MYLAIAKQAARKLRLFGHKKVAASATEQGPCEILASTVIERAVIGSVGIMFRYMDVTTDTHTQHDTLRIFINAIIVK